MRICFLLLVGVLILSLPTTSFNQTITQSDKDVLLSWPSLPLVGVAEETIGKITDVADSNIYLTVSTNIAFSFELPYENSKPGTAYVNLEFHHPLLPTRTVYLSISQARDILLLFHTFAVYSKLCYIQTRVSSSFYTRLPYGLKLLTTPMKVPSVAPFSLITLSLSHSGDNEGIDIAVTRSQNESLDMLVNDLLPKAIISAEYMQTIPAPTLDTVCPQLPERE